MFDFATVKHFLLFSIGGGAMVHDVLRRIRGRRRFVPATGTASSLVEPQAGDEADMAADGGDQFDRREAGVGTMTMSRLDFAPTGATISWRSSIGHFGESVGARQAPSAAQSFPSMRPSASSMQNPSLRWATDPKRSKMCKVELGPCNNMLSS
jgi:hypothetical protein